MTVSNKYGVRIYPLDAEVVLIKQTVKRAGSARYVVDTLSDGTHIETHIDKSDSAGIADAVLRALKGQLSSRSKK